MDVTKYENIIFDFDGTLARLHVNWPKLKTELHLAVLQQYKISIDFSGYAQGLNEVHRVLGSKGSTFANAICAKHEMLAVDTSPLIEKTIVMARNFSGKKVIWSSNQSCAIRAVLKKHALDKLFSAVIGRDHVALAKPHIDGYIQLQKVLALIPKKTLFVGDSPADQGAADALGIRYLDVTVI